MKIKKKQKYNERTCIRRSFKLSFMIIIICSNNICSTQAWANNIKLNTCRERKCSNSNFAVSRYNIGTDFRRRRCKHHRTSLFQSTSKHNKAINYNNNSTNAPIHSTMDTSLCIIPPSIAWDDIQRARHTSHDPSFYNWPPAIRLFHPFIPKSQKRIESCALDIAQIIETYNIEPFNVTLDHLLILPHLEVIEKMEEERKSLPSQVVQDEDYEDYDEDNDGRINKNKRIKNKSRRKNLIKMSKEDREVQALIRSEELKGIEKLKKRLAKEQSDHNQQNNIDNRDSKMTTSSTTTTTTTSSPSDSPRQLLQNQLKSKQQFNGPCILCLEPDEESQIQLQTVREILRKKLFDDYDPFSPSSILPVDNVGSNDSGRNDMNDDRRLLPKSVLNKHGLLMNKKKTKNKNNDEETDNIGNTNKRKKKKQEGSTYRPLIILGQFSTVTKAVETARRLQRSWEPLTFEVCDLQLVSRNTPSSSTSSESSSSPPIPNNDPIRDNYYESNIYENREYELRKYHGTLSSSSGGSSVNEDVHDLTVNGEYGCDAMMMLMGEEPLPSLLFSISPIASEEVDKDYTNDNDNDIFDLLMTQAGTPGGAVKVSDEESSFVSNEGQSFYVNDDDISDENDEGQSMYNNIEDWLSDDDDDGYDEGATVVIGRTQFFMGEMRQYTGMPASSTIDRKDKKIGESVSGSARRRGAVHRQGDRWNDGDFGVKEKDLLP